MFPNAYMSIASNPFTKLCSGNKSHTPPLNRHTTWENGTGNPYKAKRLTEKRRKAVKTTKAPLAPLATRMTTNPTGKRAATAAKKFQLTKQIAPLHLDT